MMLRFIILIVASLTILLSSASCLSIKSSSNGCGPKGFPINNGLSKHGEAVLIECCNQHDLCYGNCLGKSECDDQFEWCLLQECSLLTFDLVQKCKTDAYLMSSMVKMFGGPFYCVHRKK